MIITNNIGGKTIFFLKFFVFITVSSMFLNTKIYAEQVLEGIYYDWSVFVLKEVGEEKKCYMAAFPKKSLGNYKKNREPYFLITRFGDKNIEEISLYSGFEYKIGSDIYLSIDGKQYTLFTKNDIAWSKNKEQDKDIITALLDGFVLKVRAESSKSEYVVDEYSLKGTTRAYKRIRELCKKDSK